METKNYIAIDLGAESGRVIIGTFDGKHINLQEIHRFKTGYKESSPGDTLYWDVYEFFDEIKKGLKLCSKHSSQFDGIGVDTWGVDFGLLDKSGKLMGNPVHYRDKRTDGMLEKVFAIIPREEIYRVTGIQFMQINTLYQLYSMVLKQPELLKRAECLLMMPCLFNYFLSGEKVNEYTISTTSQCYDLTKDCWADSILEKLGIPVEIFATAVKPGTAIGNLLPEISKETGLGNIPVIAVGSHDTASAVAAVPAKSSNWAFLSSGTWSLLGCEIKKPIINEHTLEYNLTNEGGVGGKIRLLNNVMGLWIIKECRRHWAESGDELSYPEITDLAVAARPFQSFIDVNNNLFLKTGNMPENIQKWCQESEQKIPEDKGSIIRCVLESLAFKYREVIERLEKIQNGFIDTVHIVGGGTQNKLLCKLTANATAREVVTGPTEATAAGNIIMQCVAQKEISSISQAREILGNSFNLITYGSEQNDNWEDAYRKYLSLIVKP